MPVMMRSFFPHIYKDMGIDLGTANTIVCVTQSEIVVNEPSVIAFSRRGDLYALGLEAKKMMGKTHSGLRVTRPMANGVIADFVAAEQMIKGFIRKAGVPRFFINKMVLGVPAGITSVEKKAVIDSAVLAGARKAYLIAEPMAAAIGVGLDVLGRDAAMIVDIGGGTTDIAVINYGGIILDNTLRIAGDEMDEAVVRLFKNRYHLRIGLQSAETLKIKYGIAHKDYKGIKFEVQGIDIETNLPRRIKADSTVFLEAFSMILKTIANAVLSALEKLPPDLAGDLIDRGIILSGGGSLLKGFDLFLREKIKIPVSIPDNTLFCVAAGTRGILNDFKRFEPVLFSGRRMVK